MYACSAWQDASDCGSQNLPSVGASPLRSAAISRMSHVQRIAVASVAAASEPYFPENVRASAVEHGLDRLQMQQRNLASGRSLARSIKVGLVVQNRLVSLCHGLRWDHLHWSAWDNFWCGKLRSYSQKADVPESPFCVLIT